MAHTFASAVPTGSNPGISLKEWHARNAKVSPFEGKEEFVITSKLTGGPTTARLGELVVHLTDPQKVYQAKSRGHKNNRDKNKVAWAFTPHLELMTLDEGVGLTDGIYEQKVAGFAKTDCYLPLGLMPSDPKELQRAACVQHVMTATFVNGGDFLQNKVGDDHTAVFHTRALRDIVWRIVETTDAKEQARWLDVAMLAAQAIESFLAIKPKARQTVLALREADMSSDMLQRVVAATLLGHRLSRREILEVIAVSRKRSAKYGSRSLAESSRGSTAMFILFPLVSEFLESKDRSAKTRKALCDRLDKTLLGLAQAFVSESKASDIGSVQSDARALQFLLAPEAERVGAFSTQGLEALLEHCRDSRNKTVEPDFVKMGLLEDFKLPFELRTRDFTAAGVPKPTAVVEVKGDAKDKERKGLTDAVHVQGRDPLDWAIVGLTQPGLYLIESAVRGLAVPAVEADGDLRQHEQKAVFRVSFGTDIFADDMTESVSSAGMVRRLKSDIKEGEDVYVRARPGGARPFSLGGAPTWLYIAPADEKTTFWVGTRSDRHEDLRYVAHDLKNSAFNAYRIEGRSNLVHVALRNCKIAMRRVTVDQEVPASIPAAVAVATDKAHVESKGDAKSEIKALIADNVSGAELLARLSTLATHVTYDKEIAEIAAKRAARAAKKAQAVIPAPA